MWTKLTSLFGTSPDRRPRGRGRLIPRLEPLSERLASATLVNPTTLTYQDADGDLVTVRLSKPLLTTDNVNNVFAFNQGNVADGNDVRQQLQRINLVSFPGGTSVTVTAALRRPDGDGFANVGHVNADSVDLGKVTIDGDLGQIDAGDADPAMPALRGLTVQSMGKFTTTTQGANPSLLSVIQGHLGAMVVKGDLESCTVRVIGGVNGTIGSVTIGGSLVGTSSIGSGSITTEGDMGRVRIAGDLMGGTMEDSGVVVAFGSLAGVTVGGSLLSSGGLRSGMIFSFGNMGPVKIVENVEGFFGDYSGRIATEGTLAGVKIGGKLIGGDGMESGQIFSRGDMGPVKVGGDVRGAAGIYSGRIITDGSLAGVTIGGSLLGGIGFFTGDVFSKVNLGRVQVRGDVKGGGGLSSGQISADGSVAAVTIGSSLVGGSGTGSGGLIKSALNLGPVKIAGDLEGGSDSGRGYVKGQRIASVSIGGSVIAGQSAGGALSDNGAILAVDDLGPITVRGNLVGNANHTVLIRARGQAEPSATRDVAIASLRVGGNVEFTRVLAGYGASPNADAQIGAVSVGGNWVASSIVAGAEAGADAHFGTDDDRIRVGNNQPGLVSQIASIAIRGEVRGTAAGGDHYGFVAEHVGSLTVAGKRLPLKAGTDVLPVGTTGDVFLREDLDDA